MLSKDSRRLLGASFNLLNSILGGGSGLVPIPFLVRTTGLVYAPLLLGCTAMWAAYTSWAVVRAWKITGASTYEAVALRCLGSVGGGVVRFIVVIFLFGVTVGTFDIVADVVGGEYLSRGWTVVISGLIISPVIIGLRSMDALAPLSVIAAILVVLFIVYASVTLVEGRPAATLADGLRVRPSLPDLLDALSIAVFSFLMHFNIIGIATTLPGASSAEQATAMTRVLYLTMALAFVTYLSVGVIAFLTFGAKTSGDMLADYSTTGPVGETCRYLIAASLLATIPLFTFEGIAEIAFEVHKRWPGTPSQKASSMVAHTPHAIEGGQHKEDGKFTPSVRRRWPVPTDRDLQALWRLGRPEEDGEAQSLLAATRDDTEAIGGGGGPPAALPNSTRMLVAAAWCFVSVGTAIGFKGSTSQVLALTGAMCGTPIMAVLPPLMLLRCDDSLSRAARYGNWVLVLLGSVTTIACSFSTAMTL